MLELIFQGFLEWAYGLVLESWEYFSGVLMDILSMDFSYLKTHVPIVDTIIQIMLAVGWALLLGNLVFQSLKSMVTGLGFEAEDPKLLFTHTFVFAFLLLASPQICEIGLSMTQTVIDILQVPDAVAVTFADESSFGGIGAAWLLVIIIGIVVMFKVFKLLLEIAERYVILGMLTICAPLAFGMGGSRSTSDIFTGWCRMFASMCFMMISNVIFFKMLLSVLSTIPTGLDILPWIVLVLTITKVAKKVDAIITRIGLNPAITGDSLGRSLPGMLAYTVIRSAAKQIVKTAGKNAGGGARGATPNAPSGGGSGGGPKTGAPSGGHFGGRSQHTGYSTGPAGTSSYQSASSQQSGSSQSGGQNSSAAFHSASQSTAQSDTTQQEASAQQSPPWAPEPGSTRPGSAGQDRTSTLFGNPSTRQSSVPPGTRRAGSHVRQAQSGTAVTAAASVAGRFGQRPGASNGTAGTDASGVSAQPGKMAQGSVPTAASGQSRYAQSVRQTAQGGDTSTTEYNSQQQNMSASATVQPKQPASGTAGTRYTSRSATTQAGSANGTAGTGSSRSQPQAQATSASSTVRQERQSSAGVPGASGTMESPIRQGRNAAPSSASAPSAKTTASPTARQERSSSMGSSIPQAPGMAGMSGRVSGERPQGRSAARPAERAQSGPRATTAVGTGNPASETARQETARSSERQSSREKKGGAGRGEQQ